MSYFLALSNRGSATRLSKITYITNPFKVSNSKFNLSGSDSRTIVQVKVTVLIASLATTSAVAMVANSAWAAYGDIPCQQSHTNRSTLRPVY